LRTPTGHALPRPGPPTAERARPSLFDLDRAAFPGSMEEPTMAGGLLDRVAVRQMGRAAERRWGFRPTIQPYLIKQLGAFGGLRWGYQHMARYIAVNRALGPIRTHLACVTISQLNGCRYTARGHGLALELHYLRERDKLLPVDADTLAEWAGLPRAELRSKLAAALMSANLHVELMWVDKTIALVEGSQRPIDGDEARLAHLIAQFQVLNAVGVAAQPEYDEAHDSINRDEELKARLAALRTAANS
jgi:hypothetical protein